MPSISGSTVFIDSIEKFTGSFSESDFIIGGDGRPQISIPETTHGKGAHPTIEVYIWDGEKWGSAEGKIDEYVFSSGDIVLEVEDVSSEFRGKYEIF